MVPPHGFAPCPVGLQPSMLSIHHDGMKRLRRFFPLSASTRESELYTLGQRRKMVEEPRFELGSHGVQNRQVPVTPTPPRNGASGGTRTHDHSHTKGERCLCATEGLKDAPEGVEPPTHRFEACGSVH